jgi:hypothetical protein
LDEVGKRIGVVGDDLTPWYAQSVRALYRFGLSRLLHFYDNSIYLMLKSIYPNYDWIPWRFKHSPRAIVVDASLRRSLIDFLLNEHGLESPIDILRLTNDNLKRCGALSIVNRCGGLQALLDDPKS